MKKDNQKVGIILLLILIALTSYFVAGTYSKYTNILSGNDKATVAKFSVTASGLNKEQNADIDLFDTVKEANTADTEENVIKGRIAPGTGGEFKTTLTNASEVDVKAVLSLKETANENNVPIGYSLDKTNWKKSSEITKEISLDYVGKTIGKTTEDVTIYWRWAYEGTDTIDTGLGEMTTAPTVTTQVSVTFTQVD